MKNARQPIRAATKVVSQPKPQERWTVERARLARLHAEAMQQQEYARRVAVSQAESRGRHEGQQQVLRSSFEDADFRKYFWRAAADRLGQAVGSQIDRDFRAQIDPTLNERKRLFDARLALAEISFDLRDNPMSQERVVVTRVDLPRQDFHFAHPI